jgi:hypothetical protein
MRFTFRGVECCLETFKTKGVVKYRALVFSYRLGIKSYFKTLGEYETRRDALLGLMSQVETVG